MSIHIEWRGTVIDNTAGSVGFVDLRGWFESPDTRQSDTDRGGRHGQIAGQLLASGRIVEVDWLILDGQTSTLVAMMAATSPDENPVEETLLVSGFDGFPAQTINARPTRWTPLTVADFVKGKRQGTWQFKATDPRLYNADASSVTTQLATSAGSGLAFPLGWPADFGPLPAGGQLAATNIGSASTWPVFILNGPLTGPVITELATGRQIRFASTFVIAAGQQVVIDTDARTVLLNGVSRRDQVTAAQWFPIGGGQTVQIGFTAALAETGLLTVQWRDAWM